LPTKMNYRRNETRKKRIKIFSAVAIIAALLFLQEAIFNFSSGAAALAAPLVKLSDEAGDKAKNGFFAAFSTKRSLVEKNEFLKARISEIEAKLLDYGRVSKENDELKIMLGRGGDKKTILAVVIGKPNRSPYDTLILDIGESDGVRVGQKVIAYGDVIFGEIEEVSDTTSRAVLFSSYGKEYEAVLSSGNIPVKLLGRGVGNFLAELPRGLFVAKGDLAVSPELNSKILGVAESISSDPREPYQRIIFRSPVNQNELRFVEIEI